MKRFHFRLQKLMDAKESEEKEKQRLFGEAQQLVIESEMELNSLEDALEQSIRERRTLQERKVSIAELMIHDKWKIHLQKKIREQQTIIRQRMEIAEDRREELVIVSQEKRVLEKLKEKRWADHEKQLNAEEQSFLDDLGSRKTGIL